MSKTTIINSSVLSGFVELLPEKQMIFDKVVDIVSSVYKSSGYVNIDTPIIEKSEVLLAKAGGETEKQIYRIIKGDNDLALRFDLTIPFARYVANHFNDLKMPFKRFQIGKVYRGERAQKGRYREFYQADIDLVNPNNLSNMYEIDVISTIVNVLLSLSDIFFLGSFCVKISSRKIWDAVLNNFNFSYSKKEKLFSIIDKKNKMEEDVFYIELEKIIDNKEQFNLIKSMFSLNFSILSINSS